MEEFKVLRRNDNYEVSNMGRIRNRRTGGFVGSISKQDGYAHLTLRKNGVVDRVRLHTLVWEEFGSTPQSDGMVVDHINNDKADNRLVNLQLVTQRENSIKDMKTVSGVAGAHWNNKKKRYISNIQIEGRRYYLGSSRELSIAAKLYQEALINWEEEGRLPKRLKHISPDGFKKCSGCEVDLPYSEFDTYRTSNGHDSLRPKCRECFKEYRRINDKKYRNKLKTNQV